DRVRCDDRAEVAGRGQACEGGPHGRREAAADAARWRARHLLDRGHALRLRRVHPARDLAGDAARSTFAAVAFRARADKKKRKGPTGSFLLLDQEARVPAKGERLSWPLEGANLRGGASISVPRSLVRA